MHAQHQTQQSVQNKAEIARLLLQANDAYGESNNPRQRYARRLEARQESRELLEKIATMAPDNAAVYGLLGRIEMDEGRLDRAQLLFNQSLSINPDQAQQYTNLGYWALTSDRPALAEQYFQEALNRDRQSAAAFCGIAHAKRQQGQFDVAYLHYRKLVQLDLNWPSVFSGMATCASHLSVDRADTELAQDAIRLLQRSDLPHQVLGGFVAGIIRQQYDLDNPAARIILDAASDDELLLLALEKTLMPDVAVEGLITLLRHAILVEVAQTADLREELHRLVMALALYADRTGYALLTGEQESALVDTINNSIAAQFALGESMNAIAGSLMISAMYGALFHQSFAPSVGQWNLTEWPVGLQSLMAASYYHRATEESIKQQFDEKAGELALARADVPQAWPSWTRLTTHPETSLKSLMNVRLGLDDIAMPETARIMICGADSGQRALELATCLNDVEIIAVDESLSNIARAGRHAQDRGLENIVFWPWSLAQRFIADGHKVQWIEIGRLPSTAMTETSLAAIIQDAAAQDTVVHLHTCPTGQLPVDRHLRELIEQHDLPATSASLRRLRWMVLNNAQDPVWADLLKEEDFFGLGGCHSRWFRPQDSRQLETVMAMLCNEVDWKLVRAQDNDGHTLSLGPVQKQLHAEASGNSVQSVVGQPLTLYFTKRR